MSERKAPNPATLHPMQPRPTPYVAPCGAILNNALVAWAHWLQHWECPMYARSIATIIDLKEGL